MKIDPVPMKRIPADEGIGRGRPLSTKCRVLLGLLRQTEMVVTT